MESIIQVIDKRCAEQVKRADDLLKVLEAFGWKDTRPNGSMREKKVPCFSISMKLSKYLHPR